MMSNSPAYMKWGTTSVVSVLIFNMLMPLLISCGMGLFTLCSWVTPGKTIFAHENAAASCCANSDINSIDKKTTDFRLINLLDKKEPSCHTPETDFTVTSCADCPCIISTPVSPLAAVNKNAVLPQSNFDKNADSHIFLTESFWSNTLFSDYLNAQNSDKLSYLFHASSHQVYAPSPPLRTLNCTFLI
ncbi:MAG: hypothetical protein LAT67_01580 [Balneolales bacterium]|nr:hypothetical protein [Balneolales bacterium]